jgi:hypothetical protein
VQSTELTAWTQCRSERGCDVGHEGRLYFRRYKPSEYENEDELAQVEGNKSKGPHFTMSYVSTKDLCVPVRCGYGADGLCCMMHMA